MSDSARPHRRQPTRLPRPWDSPGKNIGVGCHFLLQCMKVKSESEVAQSYLNLSDPMDCSPSGSSIYGIFQARILEWVAIHLPRSEYIWNPRCIYISAPETTLENLVLQEFLLEFSLVIFVRGYTCIIFTFHFHALEKEMAAHSNVLAWRIPGMGEPGGLLSVGSHRVGHNWSNLAAAAAAYMHEGKLCLHVFIYVYILCTQRSSLFLLSCWLCLDGIFFPAFFTYWFNPQDSSQNNAFSLKFAG